MAWRKRIQASGTQTRQLIAPYRNWTIVFLKFNRVVIVREAAATATAKLTTFDKKKRKENSFVCLDCRSRFGIVPNVSTALVLVFDCVWVSDLQCHENINLLMWYARCRRTEVVQSLLRQANAKPRKFQCEKSLHAEMAIPISSFDLQLWTSEETG